MKLMIDTDAKLLTIEHNGQRREVELYSDEGFELLSRQWLKVGWNQKYVYTFTWMGRPIIQLPEDLMRVQEVIYDEQPDVLIETGVAHGGSLIFYASLFKAMGRGRVVGIDIEIRPHNRRAIEAHPLFPLITLIEGDSIASETLIAASNQVRPGDRVMVILDSNHSKTHVLAELEAYAGLVSPGSYIVATDGSMRDLYDVPRGRADWAHNNPAAAAAQFATSHREFRLVEPSWHFNESGLTERLTYWPDAFLRRVEGTSLSERTSINHPSG
jgi:cephalosporin hydroxylase